MLFPSGPAYGVFPSFDGNSVRSMRACIRFARFDAVAALVTFALDDESTVFDTALIILANQPRQPTRFDLSISASPTSPSKHSLARHDSTISANV